MTAPVPDSILAQHIAIGGKTGAWWGLRSSKDGKRAGYPVVLFGATA